MITVRSHLTALRMLLAFTAVLGIGYPLAVTAVAQFPGLRGRADGSLLTAHGRVVGSRLLAQPFTGKDGNPLPQYFQERPSAVDYDPTSSGASNLGPESIIDRPGRPSLLTRVCARSLAVGRLEHASGARPYCTPDGVGAVLAVFYARPGYRGAVTHAVSVNQLCPVRPFVTRYADAPVTCAVPSADYAAGKIVAIRGTAPADPAVPADAVTASGSGLDPDISPAYARLQEARVARTRGITLAQVDALVRAATSGRTFGFFGEPVVDVLELNARLDAMYPYDTGQ